MARKHIFRALSLEFIGAPYLTRPLAMSKLSLFLNSHHI